MRKDDNKFSRPLFSHSGEFLSDYLPLRLGRSVNTISSYRNCLRLLRDYIEACTHRNFYRFPFSEATREFILGFLTWIESRGCCRATRNQRLACLKTYAKFVMDQDFEMAAWGASILSIPMATAKKPLVGWLREEVLESILRQPGSSVRGIRDRALMVVMYETGARVSEMVGLRLRDLNIFPSGSSVRLHGKGGKTREVPLGEKAVGLLGNHLRTSFPDVGGNVEDYVFSTVIHGKKCMMSIGNVERLVSRYASKARKSNPLVPERVTPHMFRHTRATHLLRAKMPLPLIGRFLGHVDLETTNIYASCDVEMLREAIGAVELNTPDMIEEPVWIGNKEMISRLCGL